MSNASNLSANGAFFNSCHNGPAMVSESWLEEMVTKAMLRVLMNTPLAQLEAILERRRREDF